MSALETYLTQVAAAKGLHRQRRMYNMRDYIKRSSDEEMLMAISRITDAQHLKILWEAGLNAVLQKAVATRMGELGYRRRL